MGLDALYRKSEDVAADLHHAVAYRTTACDIQFLDVLARTRFHTPHGMIEFKIDAFDDGPVEVGLVMEVAQAHDHALGERIVVSR